MAEVELLHAAGGPSIVLAEALPFGINKTVAAFLDHLICSNPRRAFRADLLQEPRKGQWVSRMWSMVRSIK